MELIEPAVAARWAVRIEGMIETLSLTPGELLSTTRSVRRRLDLTRPVERTVLEECLRLAQQAPPVAMPRSGTLSW
jgi:hypothetical protein